MKKKSRKLKNVAKRTCKHCGERSRYFVSACPACHGSPNITPAEARDTVKLLKKAGTNALVSAGISKKFITSHVVFM